MINIPTNINAKEQLNMLHGMDAKPQLTEIQKQQLAKAYFELYFGLACTNWCNKKTLGAAWQTALDQTDAFIKSKKTDNPAAMYLHQIHASHKTAWPKHIMSHPKRDSMLEASKDEIAKLKEYGAKSTKSALDKIGVTLKQYEKATPKQAAGTLDQSKHPNKEQIMELLKAKQKLLQMQINQNQNQYAA